MHSLQASSGGRTGQVRDSARRQWRFEVREDLSRGRFIVFSPVHGDLEPFRASADHFRPDAYLAIDDEQWSVFAGLAARPDDAALQAQAFRVFDRMVRAAQHQSLLGAAEDEDD